MPDHAELRAAHGEDLVAEPGLVVASESLDIDRIMADQLANFVGKLGGVSEDIFVGIWRQKAAHGDPIDSSGG